MINFAKNATPTQRSMGIVAAWIASLPVLLSLTAVLPNVSAQDADQPAAVPAADSDASVPETTEKTSNETALPQLRPGYLVQVPLPITDQVDTSVRRALSRILERLPEPTSDSEPPVVLLEFDTTNGITGQGSQFERCVALARFLTSREMGGVHTVAYIPRPRGLYVDQAENQVSLLKGHAVLVALACDEVILNEAAAIGAAGIDEDSIDPLIRESYRSIAQRTRTLPEPLVMALLDRNESVFRAFTNDGDLFVNAEELARLEAEGKSVDSETVSDMGDYPLLSSEMLVQYGLIRHRVPGRQELARRLMIDVNVLEIDPSLGERWQPVLLKIEGAISQQRVNWIERALDQQLSEGQVNLIIVEIESVGGSLAEGLRLAHYLSKLDPKQVRTVAYVPELVRGPATLIALACDQLVVTPAADLGGEARPTVDQQALAEMAESIRELADAKQRDWSLYSALIDPAFVLKRYRHVETGQLRLMGMEQRDQLEDRDAWAEMGEIDTSAGLTGEQAERLAIARHLASDFSMVRTLYQLDGEIESLQPTLSDQWISRFAAELARPWVAGWLLFAMMFFLSAELSSPGIGVPGFISALCVVLFFWSQYLDGNADWLEILLFVLGAVCIVLELFVLPGVGVFGIGGLLMLVVSIILASQTFIVPRSSEELRQLPVSLSMVLAAGGGVVAAVFVLQRYMGRIPIFNRLMLDPQKDHSFENVNQREQLTHFEHLLGTTGVASTELLPSGKATIDGRPYNVITDGRLIEKGTPIKVTEVAGNRIVVMPRDR